MKAVAIVLLALYGSLLLKPAVPMLDYVLNYEYISEVLCINKAQPQLQCDGKCHLRTQLESSQDEEAPGKPVPPTSEEEQINYFLTANVVPTAVASIATRSWGTATFGTLGGYESVASPPPWSLSSVPLA